MDGENPQHSSDAPGGWQFKPGDTVGPGGATPEQSLPQEPTPQEQPPLQPADAEAYQPQQNFQQPVDDNVVTWSASEFIAHQKTLAWYAALAAVTVIASAIIYLLTKDKISTGAIVAVAVILGIGAARKPRTLPYQLDQAGITIGTKFYDYGQFRSFAVMDEGAFSSIVLMPLKRFMPLITIYFDPRDEGVIVDTLSQQLPMETHRLDPIDQLMRKIRF